MIAIRKDAMRYRDPETGKFVGVSLIGGDAPSDTSGTPVEIDGTLTQSGKAADAKAVGDRLSALNEANAKQDAAIEALGGSVHKRTNVMIIAHRGWHETAAQNTIEAFIDAVKNGFKWLEIDIRKTADNVYVMAHDATVTLYNNGTAQSVTIASANYADIKNMTWDAAGKYGISTLAGVFGAMRGYDVRLICDRKSGNNSDIVRLASHSGIIDKIMLSYASASAAIAEKELLLRYDNVPIRFIPSDETNIETLRIGINNPIYADVNASEVTHYQQYLCNALAYDIPIIFSGCLLSNKAIWQVLAAGCMANLSENIRYDDFAELIAIDYGKTCEITANDVTVAPNNTVTLETASSIDEPAGYIYGFMADTTYASIKQKTFGSSSTFEITGKAEGSTQIVLFCGNGAIKTISVLVATEAEESIPCTGIELDKTSLTFDGAGSQTLTATVTPSNTTDTVTWSSDDSSVASVSGGTVTAVGNGSTTITATCGAYRASCAVSVSGVGGGAVEETSWVFLKGVAISAAELNLNYETRMAMVAEGNWCEFTYTNGTPNTSYSPIPIPEGTTQITLVAPELYGGLALYDCSSGKPSRTVDVGWSTIGGWTYTLPKDKVCTHFTINYKNQKQTTLANYDTSRISVTLS